MNRYATREDEVDRLLRGRVFVDLHRVVRQGLRASVESYSIKRLEPFYGFARAVDLITATRALIQVEVRFDRREDKSMWWEFLHRCGFTEEEHVESRATLGALTYDGEVEQVKRSVVHRYPFSEQPHEIKVGDSPKNPDTAESDELKRGFCGTVVALDETGGTIDLKRGRSSPVPHPAALVPLDNVQNTVLRESLARLAEAVVSGGFAADSPRRAAFDLLGRVPPRIEPASPPNASGYGVREGLAAQGEAPLAAVRRIAPRLYRSVLPVQGPPGSGKTYTGARMILDLLAGGRRVGVTANSHKVISNLLAAVCDAADEPSVENDRAGSESGDRPTRQAPVGVSGIQKGERRRRLSGRTHRPGQFQR